MSELAIGSLCAGYGGLDLAVESALGARTAWVSDIDKGACKVLAHRFPNAPNIGDMTAVDWAAVEPVDIITGGTPCQDLSHAGKRAAALRALGRVLGDLDTLGYVGGWHGLRAADVGAPHGRLRVFVVATDASNPAGYGEWARTKLGQGGETAADTNGRLDLASGTRSDQRPVPGSDGTGARPHRLLPSPTVSDTNGAGQHGDGGLDLRTAVSMLPTPQARDWKGYGPSDGDRHDPNLSAIPLLLPTPRVANNENRQSEGYGGKDGNFHGLVTGQTSWGQYAAAIARWESLTRPAPAPTETGPKGNPRLSPLFTEWMMGLPAGWITDVPDVTRNEALKLCGNGVVSQQAEAAIRFLLPLIARAAA